MSLRDRRKLIEAKATDEQVKTAKKDKWDELADAILSKKEVADLLKNKVFIAMLNLFDELEERAYEELRVISGPEQTNFTRGQIDFFRLLRNIIRMLNG